MDKIKPLFPSTLKDNKEDDFDGFFQLLRDVVDGDKNAIKTLRDILDVADMMKKQGFKMPEMEEHDWLSDEEDYEEVDDIYGMVLDGKIPLTLVRDHVQEYYMRIKLNGIDTKIWREIKVPSNLRLDVFAEVLQDAMGWEHEHLYQFVRGYDYYADRATVEDDFGFGRMCGYDMSKYTVGDIFSEKGKRVRFEYDFGDSWEHDVWMKSSRDYEKKEKPSITFVKGAGACPPEDCGGVYGYVELLQLRQKKKLSKNDRERLEWYGISEDYNPEDFDPETFVDVMGYWDSLLKKGKKK